MPVFYPNSYGGDELLEYNKCHNPAGPGGGRFCSTEGEGAAASVGRSGVKAKAEKPAGPSAGKVPDDKRFPTSAGWADFNEGANEVWEDRVTGLSYHLDQRRMDPDAPLEEWYPETHKHSLEVEASDPKVKARADKMRADPTLSPLEKAYAGLIAEAEMEGEESQKSGGSLKKWLVSQDDDGDVWNNIATERKVFYLKCIEEAIKQAAEKRGKPISTGLETPSIIYLGGNTGAGKSTVAGKAFDKPDALVVNPDDMKDIIKQLDPSLKGASASFLHEESGLIADMMIEYAMMDRVNIIVDGTMKSAGDPRKGMNDHTSGRIKKAKEEGYRAEVRFVDVNIEQSVLRSMTRYLGMVEDLLSKRSTKEPRFVPAGFIRNGLSKKRPRDAYDIITDTPGLVDGHLAVNGWNGKHIEQAGSLLKGL